MSDSPDFNLPTPGQIKLDEFWAAVLEILDNQFRYWDEMGFSDIGNEDYSSMDIASLLVDGFPITGELRINKSLAEYIKSLLREQLAIPEPKNFDQDFILVYQAFIFTMIARNAENQAISGIEDLSHEY